MELKEQVCKLELAKELRLLGIRQYSLWYWIKDGKEDIIISDEVLINKGGLPCLINVFSAFTVAELGNMLKDVGYRLPRWERDTWDILQGKIVIGSENEADARAKMLIWIAKKQVSGHRFDWLNR